MDKMISANALNKKIYEHPTRWSITKDKVIQYINELPNQERHGHWRHDKDDVLVSGYCSACGWLSIIMETDVANMPYCPNCGAKMDEVEK